jgi:mono/diheme cytochrome c family protein
MNFRRGIALLIFSLALLSAGLVQAEPRLTVTIGASTRSFGQRELLSDPAAMSIEVARDAAYGRPMRYRAVPLSVLLAGISLPPDQVLEAVASDGFVAMLPIDLILHPVAGGAAAYLAVEPPDAPWPALSGKSATAGPFYLVWLRPDASGIRSEQWPYMLAEIRSADSPARRWPGLAVDPSLPGADPIRAGQTIFVTQCLVCHKLNGAGSASVGPDLNLPKNPTEYFQLPALKQYIRDPASLRRWNAMAMKGFDKDALSDHEIDLIIAYLTHMSSRKTAP